MEGYSAKNPLIDGQLDQQMLHLGHENLFALHADAETFLLHLLDVQNRPRMVKFDQTQAEALFRWLGHQLGQPSGMTRPAPAAELVLDRAEFLRPDTAERIEADAPRREGRWTLRVPFERVPRDMTSLDRLGDWLHTAGISYRYRVTEIGDAALTVHHCTNVPADLPDWIKAYDEP